MEEQRKNAENVEDIDVPSVVEEKEGESGSATVVRFVLDYPQWFYVLLIALIGSTHFGIYVDPELLRLFGVVIFFYSVRIRIEKE
jgi:hypothetical protein